MWIGRSWVRSPSTSGPRRATASSSSWAIGSSLRLPLVITSGRPTPGHEEVVERAVGQQQAELGQAGRDGVGHRRAGPAGHEDDRPSGRRERRRGAAASSSHEPLGRGQVGDHHREGLVVAGLAAAQLGDRTGVGGVDGEVVAADALDGDDPPAAQRVHRGAERVGTAGHAPRPTSPARPAAGRTPGRRWAGRGSDDRPGRRTRPGRPGTSRSRPSSWPAGRTARRARSCTAARSSCSW